MDTRSVLTTEEYGAVVATVLDNNAGMDAPTAARIVDQALAFIAACAAFPDAHLVPSRVVDEGWHALILHTALYARVCEELGGFVQHIPERPDPDRFNELAIDRTTSLIEEAGYSIDYDLWTAPDNELVSVAASCQHSDDSGPIVTMPKPKG